MKLDNVGGPDELRLPDDMLLNIVERVGTLDAVRTCIASKNTLRLLTMLSQIVIVLGARELVRKNGVVADVTDRILTARSPQIPIRNLKLKFIMRGDDHLKIGRSVALAMARRKIEAAEFEILTTKCYHKCTLKVWLHRESGKLLAPLLNKLLFLNLDNIPEKYGIAWTLSFLEAAPSLQELCITVSDHKCLTDSKENLPKKTDVKWEPSVSDFKHNNLVKLTIHGFESDGTFTSYVRCVMKVAVNIHEISLHGRKLCKFCCNKSRPSRYYPRTRREKDWLSKKITEALVTASPAVIQFLPSLLLFTSGHRVL